MKLIPIPKLLQQTEEMIPHKFVNFDTAGLDVRLAKAVEKLPYAENGLALSLQIGTGSEERYILDMTQDSIVITADSTVGAFYGIQTLRQILQNETLYACHIEDAPDFSFRGFYHDVTRGRIPTMETLKELVDYMASMKLNSLQLYVEHSFAFREFADSIEETGCITPEEIRELDDYCYENFIELIPSMSCFGHLYVLLEKPQYKHLQVAKDYENTHIYWYERMAHHTIDPLHPESFPLIQSMIDQFLPLFRSDKFNICCDETFDLTNGKHKDMDTGKLYVDFTKKLITYVKSHGKQVMMWGDVLLQHPERVSDIGEDVELLNWHYGADAENAEAKVKLLRDQKRTQIVCPATWAFNHFNELLWASIPNITIMTELGYKYGAKGVLNTNWGDYGDPCSFYLSLFGIAYGAARSWNVTADADQVANCADHLIYRHPGTFDILHRINVLEHTVHYGDLSYMYNNLYFPAQIEISHRTEEALLDARQACLDICENLSTQTWERDFFRQEIMLAAEGVAIMADYMIKLRGYGAQRVTDMESWLKKYRANWLKQSKESELREIEKMFHLLEEAVIQGKTLQNC